MGWGPLKNRFDNGAGGLLRDTKLLKHRQDRFPNHSQLQFISAHAQFRSKRGITGEPRALPETHKRRSRELLNLANNLTGETNVH